MMKRSLLFAVLTCGAFGATSSAQQPATVDFARDVQPIFKQSCISCHGPAIRQNGFRLDRRSDALRGSTGNPGIIRTHRHCRDIWRAKEIHTKCGTART